MWTLWLVLCSVALVHGEEGAARYYPTEGYYTATLPSCRYNCSRDLGPCSCSSSCEYRGSCCPDYRYQCPTTTTISRPRTTTPPTTDTPSCRYYCGRDLGYCSCSSSCEYRGNCCHDYRYLCSTTTEWPAPTASPGSCLYNCGRDFGYCSCSSSCEYRGNCCHDYRYQCPTTPTTSRPRPPTTHTPSCRNNCGRYLGYCSCSSSCENRGDCCHDYRYLCLTTTWPTPTAPPVLCRHNCGQDFGFCSCSSSCEYRGNCCRDYYNHCPTTTPYWPAATTAGGSCGGHLFGSGSISSPNHPNHYQNNAFCQWQLRTSPGQRIYLSFTFLELENCCRCDYIQIYDGPSTGSPLLEKVCSSSNASLSSFHSTSTYMTVTFRSDGSVVGRGFRAEFLSSLPTSSGRVECSSSNMNIVLEKSYLNSLGYNGNDMYLNDERCRPTIYNYQVVFNYPINGCGNTQETKNDKITYHNAVRAFVNSSGEITRQTHFTLKVACGMDQDSVSQIMYLVQNQQNSSLIGSGKYNTSMAFYTLNNFHYPVTDFPYVVSLKQYLYVQVSQDVYNGNLNMFLDTCVASPVPYDFNTRAYYLIRNGCYMDNTVYVYTSGSSPYARFRFSSFQFLRASESVYIQCKVLLCPSHDSNSRCRRGCISRKARDLQSEHHSQTVVLGPIKLQDPEKQEEEAGKQEKV